MTTNMDVPQEAAASATPALSRMRLESEKVALLSIKKRLDALHFWMSARQLSRAVGETISVIGELEERFDAKAIVAVVGGTGAGKSTLVNALCGKDGTVAEGITRPTTRNIAALARSAGDANILLRNFAPGEISVRQDYGYRFSDVVLVDTPDTDSSECSHYSELLDKVFAQADALICVFPAQDPKRRDNLARLAAKISSFKAEHVFLVVNQCDRIPEQELAEVRDDFERNTRKSWAKTGRVFMVSARSSLNSPNWTQGETPLHAVNEFSELCAAIRELDGANFADSRIQRAHQLRLEAEQLVATYVRGCGDWDALCRKVKGFEERLCARLVEQEATRLVARTGDLSALLYRSVAERWHGPIGLYLHVGLFFRNSVASLRFLNPRNWTRHAVSRSQGILASRRTGEGLLLDEVLSFDWSLVKGVILAEWPAIAAELVNRFAMSPELLDGEKAVVFGELEEELLRSWPRNLGGAIEKMARARSGAFLQVVLHLPLVAMAGWALFDMLASYYRKAYLPADFYPNFGAIVLCLWLLPCWLVQCSAGVSGEKIKRTMKKELLSTDLRARLLPVLREIEILSTF